MIPIPVDALSPEALQGVIDDFIVREGTDYGERERSLDQKRAAVRRQLDHGQAQIWFDPATESTTIRLTDGPTDG